MKYLVTGGCGFIGSHIVDRLVNDGHEVIVIDNESATENKEFYKNPGAKYYKLCVTDYENTIDLYDRVDCVFHLAAVSRIQRGIESPVKTCSINYVGTAIVLECAKAKKVRRVVLSSTSSSYGTTNIIPFVESQHPDPLNVYSVSKVAAENICKVYSNIYGVDTVVLRYFNVYGPREPEVGQYATVVRLFARQKLEGKPLTIVGDGLQRRDFTHVDDVVSANILACNYENNLSGGVFNIGSGVNYSILEIAKLISNNIVHIPERVGEVRDTLADIRKAKMILKYNPKNSIIKYITTGI